MNRHLLILLLLIALISPCYGWDPTPLAFYYAGGIGSGSSASDYTENNWTYGYSYHVMGASGDTFMGALDSQMQFEEREGYNQMAYMRLGLSGRTYSMQFGDNNVRFSELTLNNMSYQGAGLTLKPTKNFLFTMVGGSKGNSYWGREVRRDTRPKEAFSGFRTTYYPTLNFGLNATYLTMGEGKDLFAYGGQYSLGDVNIFAETGSAGGGNGLIGEIKYGSQMIRLTTTYRDIDADYENPVDYVSYAGKKGLYSTVSYSPIKNMTISGGFDNYTDSLALSPNIGNADVSANVAYSLSQSTSLYLTGWRNDRKAYERGGVAEGGYASLSHSFYFMTDNIIYVKAQPAKFESFSGSEESYTEQRTIFGLNFPLFGIARFNVESETGERKITTTGSRTLPSAMEVRVDLPETKLIWEGASLTSSIDYRKDAPGALATEETTALYYDITFRYKPSKDLNFYIAAIITDVQGPETERTTARQNHVKFGLTYAFASEIYLKAGNGAVEGYVFNDKNGNGKMDQSEAGISGIMVILGDKISITDSSGHYAIGSFRGRAVEMDLSTLPEGYVCTTSNISNDIERGRVDFGLIRKSTAFQPSNTVGLKISSVK